MPLTWADTEKMARSLRERYPEAEPLDLPPETLREWVMALPGFPGAGVAMDREELRAVQMLWYELAQAEANDVSE